MSAAARRVTVSAPAPSRRRARARPAPKTRRKLAAPLAAALVAGARVALVLLEQVVLAQFSFRLAQVRAELARAEARNEELLLEAARLESPDRIERVARRALGMTDPEALYYILADVRIPPGARLAGIPNEASSVVGGAAVGAGTAGAEGW